MYKPASHRILKNRTLKRRVTSHHYTPKKSRMEEGDYALLRASQTALTKLKHKPELIQTLINDLNSRQQSSPQDPHLQQWRKLLDDLVKGTTTLDTIEAKVMGYDEQAKHLRQSAVLECLLN